jgi:hypothetical protein
LKERDMGAQFVPLSETKRSKCEYEKFSRSRVVLRRNCSGMVTYNIVSAGNNMQ